MSRADNFKKLADDFKEMAEMCLQQKDTTAWWDEFARKGGEIINLIADTPPKKEAHVNLVHAVMRKVSIDRNAAINKAQ